MPYASRAQAAYFHIHKKQLGREGVDVNEWDRASKGKSLPKRARTALNVMASKKKRNA